MSQEGPYAGREFRQLPSPVLHSEARHAVFESLGKIDELRHGLGSCGGFDAFAVVVPDYIPGFLTLGIELPTGTMCSARIATIARFMLRPRAQQAW
jgi:hypothetical protein